MSLQRKISRRIDKAIMQYNLINKGDRVLVAVSGGKDSLTLLYFLTKKAKALGFEVEGLHISNDFSNPDAFRQSRELIESWGAKLHVIDVPVQGRLKPGEKMNCYWCSTQRRLELFNFLDEHKFDSLALGHHMDDILETFLMNMLQKCELGTMLPKMDFDNYDHTIIRPLAYVKEQDIISYAEECGFIQFACTCGYDDTSKRKKVRKIIEFIAESQGEAARENMYKALHNPRERYLLGQNFGECNLLG